MDSLFIFGAEYLYIASVFGLAYIFVKLPKEDRKEFLVFTLVVFALSFCLAVLGRQIYDNPRPFVVESFQPLIPHEADNGFPSDHTLLVAAIASVIMFFRKRAAVILWVIAITVAVSRVYVGVHHFVDVIGSMLIASFSAWAVHLFLRRTKRDKIS